MGLFYATPFPKHGDMEENTTFPFIWYGEENVRVQAKPFQNKSYNLYCKFGIYKVYLIHLDYASSTHLKYLS